MKSKKKTGRLVDYIPSPVKIPSTVNINLDGHSLVENILIVLFSAFLVFMIIVTIMDIVALFSGMIG